MTRRKKAGRRDGDSVVPRVQEDGDRGPQEAPPVVPTAAEAVAFLRNYAITAGPYEVGVAIAVLLDHITKCEQALTLIRSGHESAMRHAPEHAIIDVGKMRG